MPLGTKPEYGLNNWCPFRVGETVYSPENLVGDWKITEIGMGSVRIIKDSVIVECDPQILKAYPDPSYLSQ